MESTTNKTTTEQTISDVNHLVTRIASHQDALGLPDTQFAARYKEFISSSTSWTRLKQGKWVDHLNAPKTHSRLKALVDILEGAKSFEAERFVADLPFARSMNHQYERLLGSRGDRRCLMAVAPEGVGKSWWATATLKDSNSRGSIRCYYVRLQHTWREKSWQISKALARTIGASIETGPAAQQESLITQLRALGEIVIVLDEAHYGGVVLFRIIKDLIDETPARFVYLAYPTEYDAVRSRSSGAIAEARQLLRRCIRPIFDDYRAGISPKDVQSFLGAMSIGKGVDLKAVAEELAQKLAQNQNLSTLADAVEEARGQAEDMECSLSLELVREAVNSLCSTALERKITKPSGKDLFKP